MATSWPLRTVLIALLSLCATQARAQSCPSENDDDLNVAKTASTIRGTIVRHHELRNWLGLKLDQPVCGETEIELTFDSSARWRETETLRGCQATATGVIFDGVTGYYSTKYAIQDAQIQPDASCRPFPIAPDPAKFTVPNGLRSYRVSIKIDTRGSGHTAMHARKSFHRKLPGPWLVYVNYWLNGGGDLVWLGCADHFIMSSMTAKPGSAFQETGGLAQYGVYLNEAGVSKIRFVCRRVSSTTASTD